VTAPERITVDLGPRSYEIVIGAGLINEAGRYLAPLMRAPRAMIVTDDVVAPLYGQRLESALAEASIACESIVVPSGEQTKDLAHLEGLVEELLDRLIERSTTVIALGGGVVGDLAGFAAAVVLRGVDFIQVPTTLLAQVDSSVGGKTGINTRHGKNLVGAFHQPRCVLVDTATLDTLPRRELLAGYAEVVKYGVIDDPSFFDWLNDHGADVLGGDESARRHAIAMSCRAKARVVAADERESGQRALLNLGHTFAHALEAEKGFGSGLLHGEAVAIGMVMAADLSARRGHCPSEDATRLRRHLTAVGLPTVPPTAGDKAGISRLIDHMRSDKKVSEGRITFVLVNGIGHAYLARDVDLGEVEALLAECAAA